MTYISGKISGLDIDVARLNFASAKMKLFPEVCVNPMEIEPMFGISIWLFHMFSDVWELWRCDSIYMMSNWRDSKGARIEYIIAKILRLNIYYERSTTNI